MCTHVHTHMAFISPTVFITTQLHVFLFPSYRGELQQRKEVKKTGKWSLCYNSSQVHFTSLKTHKNLLKYCFLCWGKLTESEWLSDLPNIIQAFRICVSFFFSDKYQKPQQCCHIGPVLKCPFMRWTKVYHFCLVALYLSEPLSHCFLLVTQVL